MTVCCQGIFTCEVQIPGKSIKVGSSLIIYIEEINLLEEEKYFSVIGHNANKFDQFYSVIYLNHKLVEALL